MFKKKFLRKSENYSVKNVLASIILIINAIVWLSCASGTLKEIMGNVAFTDYEILMIWSVNLLGAVTSILTGAFFADKFDQRVRFLLFWILLGMISSITPVFVDIESITGVLIISFLFSVSLGFGLPTSMAYFAEYTVIENRARLGGIVLFLAMGLGAFSLNLMATIDNIMISSFFLACLRGFSLIVFPFINSHEKDVKRKSSGSFISILRERSFILYMIPWTMFSLVNYLSAPISINVHGEEFIYFSMIIGNVLAGAFAIAGGFLCDSIGRKRIAIIGLVMLGLGYAILGIFPLNLLCWYFYIMVDGVAWGMLFVIFFITLWGDLAYGKSSEKYYALGILPFLLSNFLRLTVGPLIADTISVYAIFSFAAFFLFLAVIPLMYAPETLPEKKIRERELRKYLEKAKKIKGKYA